MPQLLQEQGDRQASLVGVQPVVVLHADGLVLADCAPSRRPAGQAGGQLLARRRCALVGSVEEVRGELRAEEVLVAGQQLGQHGDRHVGDLVVVPVEERADAPPHAQQRPVERVPGRHRQHVLGQWLRLRRAVGRLQLVDRQGGDVAEQQPAVAPHLVGVRDGREERQQLRGRFVAGGAKDEVPGEPAAERLPCAEDQHVRRQHQPPCGEVLELSQADGGNAVGGLHVDAAVVTGAMGVDPGAFAALGHFPAGEVRQEGLQRHPARVVVRETQPVPQPCEPGHSLFRRLPLLAREDGHRVDDDLADGEH